MTQRLGFGGSRRLAILLFVITVPPAMTLVWLGVRILQQDHELAIRHALERRQADLRTVVRSLEQSWGDIERALNDGAVPDGAVRLRISDHGIQAMPDGRALWLPARPALDSPGDDQFLAIERTEYRGDYARALTEYRALLQSTDPAVVAGALIRTGRIHQRQRRWDQALAAYRRLAAAERTRIAATPSDLLARREICAVLERTGRGDELRREATALERDFVSGRWVLDGPAWALTAQDLERWTGHEPVVDEQRRAVSLAAEALWAQPRAPVGTRVRQAVPIDTASVTVLQQTHDDHRVAIVVSSRKLEEWLTTAARGLPGEPTIALLSNADQRSRDEADTGANASWIAPASETGLLWTIRLDYRSSISTAVEPVRRTPLLAIGLAAIVTLLGGGGYMLWRVMRREIVVNRLQTEFVSAVSHEFRTPLTSLRHATELLNESDAISRDRRDSLYRAMDQDTRRLQRLVESLLDFSRMEAGRKAYHLRPQRIDALTHDVVDEFRDALRERDVSVAVTVADDARIAIQADAVALSNAIWNLLENAVKYSPDRPVIEVAVRRVSTGVAIAVRDYGLGIPAHEQPHVFERFMRGTRAIALGIKGTGLGLALVSHVVSAHGGRVSVDSVEGQGSTFTIWLPGAGDAARVTSQPAPGVSRSEPARQRVPDL